MELTRIAEKYALGSLPVEDLWIVAVEALEAGFDSLSLRQLAGSKGSESEVIRKLFQKTFDELGLNIPTPSEAGMALAQQIARHILQADIQPYEGAKRIGREVHSRFPHLTELDGIVAFANEYEDDEEHREDYSRLIIEECYKLLDNQQRGEMGT